MKTKLLQYGITTLVVGLLSLFIMWMKDLFIQTDSQEIMKILTDAFFAPGMIAVCFGLLIVASNGGTFHIFSYGLSSFANLFRKDRTKMRYKTFYDYKVAKEGTEKSFGYMVIIGLVFIAIVALFNGSLKDAVLSWAPTYLQDTYAFSDASAMRLVAVTVLLT